MPLQFADVMEKCYGYCATQPVILGFDGQFFISLEGLLKAAERLYKLFGIEAFADVLVCVRSILKILKGVVVDFPAVELSDAELYQIQNALVFQFKGSCDLFFVSTEGGGRTLQSAADFAAYYAQKAESVTGEAKRIFEFSAKRALQIPAELGKLNAALLEAHNFFIARGFHMTPEQRVQANVEFLKGSFRAWSDRLRLPGMTVGRYYSTPGMLQTHCVLAMDKSTGLIFIPEAIERRSHIAGAWYTQLSQNAVTFDFVYAERRPEQEQIISLPPDYPFLPLEFVIERANLSSAARDVLKQTELILFTPVINQLLLVKKRRMPGKLFAELLELEEHYNKQLRR